MFIKSDCCIRRFPLITQFKLYTLSNDKGNLLLTKSCINKALWNSCKSFSFSIREQLKGGSGWHLYHELWIAIWHFFRKILLSLCKRDAFAFPQASIPYERYGCIKAAYNVFRIVYGKTCLTWLIAFNNLYILLFIRVCGICLCGDSSTYITRNLVILLVTCSKIVLLIPTRRPLQSHVLFPGVKQ